MGTRQKHPIKQNATPILTASDPWTIGDQFRFPKCDKTYTIVMNVVMPACTGSGLVYSDGKYNYVEKPAFFISEKVIRIGNLNNGN